MHDNVFSRLLSLLLSVRAFLRSLVVPVDFGVHAIVEQAGKVVLIRQTYSPGWKFPSGGVNCREPAAHAILRELREEIGLTRSSPPELFGIYTRKIFLSTNVIALYRVRDAEFSFKPNFEVRALIWADSAAPPPGTLPGVRRRLAELTGQNPQSLYW